MKKIVWCLLMLLSFMPSTFCADDDEKIKALWFEGFRIFENAEKVEKEQGAAKSKPLYEDALKHFKGIQIKYPDWNPSFIHYRVSVCEKKIEKLKSAVTADVAVNPATAKSPETTEGVSPNEIRLLKEKLETTQKKLDNAIVFVSKSQKEIERGNKALIELEQLSKDRSELEKRYSLLSEELQKIRNNSFSESPETKNVTDKLQLKIDELNTKNEKTLQENRELTEKYRNLSISKVDSESVMGKTIEENQNMKKTLTEALDSVKGMRTDLGESSAKLRKQEEEITSLKTLIEEEKKKSSSMDDKFRGLSEKSGGLAEHLNSENELLKKDLELLKIRLDSEIKEKKELQDKAVEKDSKIQKLDSLVAELGASSKKYSSDLEARASIGEETLKKNSEMATKIKGLEEQNQNLSDEIKKIAGKYELFLKKDKEYTELAKYCLELEEKNRNNISVIDKANEESSLARKELQSSMIKKEDVDRMSGELENAKLTLVKLKEENASLVAEKGKVMTEKNNTAEEKAKMTSDLDRLSKDKQKLQEDICLAIKEKDKVAAERDALISGKNEFATEKDKLIAEKAKIVSEKDGLAAERDKLLAEKEKLLAEVKPPEAAPSPVNTEELVKALEEKKGELVELNKQKEEFASKVRMGEEKVAKLQSQGELADKKILDLIAEKTELDRKIKDGAKKVDVGSKDLNELTEYCVTLKEKSNTIENSLKGLQNKITMLETENNELKGVSSRADSKIKEAKDANPENPEKDELVKRLLETQKELNLIKEKMALGSKDKETAGEFSMDEKKMLLEAAQKSLAEGNKDSALWHYEKILSKNPEDADACRFAAAIELEKGGIDRAIELYGRAVKNCPDDKDVITGISFAYLKKGDYFSGISYLSRGLALNPADPDLLRNMGVACSSLGWKDSAEKLLRKSLEIKSDSKDTLYNLAVLIAASGPQKLEEAEKLYRKALELGAAKDPGMDELFKKE